MDEIPDNDALAAAEGTAQAGDDAGGEGAFEGEGVADGQHFLSHPEAFGTAEGDGDDGGIPGIEFHHRQIVFRVRADYVTLEDFAVGQGNVHLVGLFHHMVVGENVSPGIDDGTRARRTLLGDGFEEPVVAHHFGGDVHHTFVAKIIDRDVFHLVGGEVFRRQWDVDRLQGAAAVDEIGAAGGFRFPGGRGGAGFTDVEVDDSESHEKDDEEQSGDYGGEGKTPSAGGSHIDEYSSGIGWLEGGVLVQDIRDTEGGTLGRISVHSW